jgi:peptidoglycan/LPS O-acetylase OafA/YrhL
MRSLTSDSGKVVRSRGREELVAVTSMRGLAALAVCWFHVALWNESIPDTLFSVGRLGPHVFFIISGFVVPWVLWRADYRWSAGGRFFAKRLTRLEPPYFATIALVLIIAMMRSSVGLDTYQYSIDWSRLAAHVGYLNAFVGHAWYNEVFWTLAIEFQYYVLIALLFPLLSARHWRARTLTMVAVFCLYLPFYEPTPKWVFAFLPLFMSGFLLFQRRAGVIGAAEFWSWSVLLIATTFMHSPVMPALALLTVWLLLQNRLETRITGFLGQISYSLYLVHAPIALLQVDVLRYLESGLQRVTLAVVVMGVCIFAAWMFYLVVERPSMNVAKRIQYRGFATGTWEMAGAAQRLTGAAEPPAGWKDECSDRVLGQYQLRNVSDETTYPTSGGSFNPPSQTAGGSGSKIGSAESLPETGSGLHRQPVSLGISRSSSRSCSPAGADGPPDGHQS